MRLTTVCRFDRRSFEKQKWPIRWNNWWQTQRWRRVLNLNIAEKIEEKGFKVYTPEEALQYPVFPETPKFDPAEFEATDPVKQRFTDELSHPNYHEVPAHSYTNRSRFPNGTALDSAKNLTKTVEVGERGLPEALTSRFGSCQTLLPRQDERIMDVIKETRLFDATQKVLPVNPKVPYIGWHPVVDRMFRPMPYDHTVASWQRKVPREYGIPKNRKNLNLMRGLFRYCDFLSSEHSSLLDRAHLEKNVLREFFTRDTHRVRFYLDVPFLITDPEPLKPLADPEATKEVTLPDLYPLNCFSGVHAKNVYKFENNFPILDPSHSAPNVVLGVSFEEGPIEEPFWDHDRASSRALSSAFLIALGQARLRYGAEVAGRLPEPIVVQHVLTSGFRKLFSVFQLNTLDLDGDEGVKNQVWIDKDFTPFFSQCQYVQGRPMLAEYNPEAFAKLSAMYLHGARK